MTENRPELIAPAGDAASMQAALQAGADSVYFGADGCNMRAASNGFTPKEFPEIRKLCSSYQAKAYLALNTTIYDGELPRIRALVAKAKTSGIDAIICWDTAVIEACREAGIPFHLSTQASVSNFSAVRYYAGLGASMIVPARELTLAQVKSITKELEKRIFGYPLNVLSMAPCAWQFQVDASSPRNCSENQQTAANASSHAEEAI